MLQDPWMQWEGPFPYEALAPAYVTPESSMEEVKQAFFTLMAWGGMPPEVRQAWDALRLVPRRLFVDLFLYPIDLRAEIERAEQALAAAPPEWPPPPDLSYWLEIDGGELQRMAQESRAIALAPEELPFLTELADLALPEAGLGELARSLEDTE
jgi:hypothetical protein